MRNNYWTGVGNRVTPEEYKPLMRSIALKLSEQGYILRSGGADGADRFWEEGARDNLKALNIPEIYIPWLGFNGNRGQCFTNFGDLSSEIQKEAIKIVKSVHPSHIYLKPNVLRLHGRNVLQCLGKDLNTPSKFLLCYADINKDGTPKGGTRVAWEVAKMYDIPTFNLYFDEVRERLEEWINE